MAGNATIIVLLGPTASGKSALALGAARELGGHILSLDSMQIYCGMDVGTAKSSTVERSEVPHHLIDVVTPDQTFSVAQFVERADGVIAAAQASGTPLVAAGGTPLYYKALFEGLFDGPAADEAVRAALNAQPSEALHRRLGGVDPAAAARIHVGDRRRLVRALEVFELTGRPISALQQQWEAGRPHRHAARWFGLAWEKDALNRRINARVKAMIAAGWVEEVRELLRQYPAWSKTAAEATGYAEIVEHLRGRLSLEDAVERIKIATRQLARRQMKWFRRFPNVVWLDGTLAEETLVATVLERGAV